MKKILIILFICISAGLGLFWGPKTIDAIKLQRNRRYNADCLKALSLYGQDRNLSVLSLSSSCEYIMIEPGTNAEPDSVVAFCQPETHDNKGCSFLFTDGSAMWVKLPMLEEFMKQKGLSEYWKRH